MRDVTLESLHDVVGVVTQDAHLFHDTIRLQPALRAARGHRAGADRGVRGGADLGAGRQPARRAGHGGRRPGIPAVRRREAARCPGPAAAEGALGGRAGRGDRPPGLRVGGGRAAGPEDARCPAGRRWSSRTGCPPSGKPTRSWSSTRAGSPSAARTPSCWPRAGCTPTCTTPSSPTRRSDVGGFATVCPLPLIGPLLLTLLSQGVAETAEFLAGELVDLSGVLGAAPGPRRDAAVRDDGRPEPPRGFRPTIRGADEPGKVGHGVIRRLSRSSYLIVFSWPAGRLWCSRAASRTDQRQRSAQRAAGDSRARCRGRLLIRCRKTGWGTRCPR